MISSTASGECRWAPLRGSVGEELYRGDETGHAVQLVTWGRTEVTNKPGLLPPSRDPVRSSILKHFLPSKPSTRGSLSTAAPGPPPSALTGLSPAPAATLVLWIPHPLRGGSPAATARACPGLTSAERLFNWVRPGPRIPLPLDCGSSRACRTSRPSEPPCPAQRRARATHSPVSPQCLQDWDRSKAGFTHILRDKVQPRPRVDRGLV